MPNTIQDVLLRLVIEEPTSRETGCWTWPMCTNQYGYGVVRVGPRNHLVHRLVYEHFCGSVPDGLELDHLCRNRRCANFEHLEPVTHAENVWRGALDPGKAQRDKTHCPMGHAYSPENTRIANGSRICKACRNQKARTTREKRRREGAASPPASVCRRGHPLEGANLRITPSGYNACRACARINYQDWLKRKENANERIQPELDESKD